MRLTARCGSRKQKTHPAEPWVGLDVLFSTLAIVSIRSSAHPCGAAATAAATTAAGHRVGDGQVIGTMWMLLNLRPPRAPSASVEAVSLPLRLSIRYGGDAIDVKARVGAWDAADACTQQVAHRMEACHAHLLIPSSMSLQSARWRAMPWPCFTMHAACRMTRCRRWRGRRIFRRQRLFFPGDAETEEREGVRVRIFTTQEELPFAGHPTLGTATWLYLNHPHAAGRGDDYAAAECREHQRAFRAREEGVAGVRGTMTQNDPVFGATHDREEVARAIGLKAEDLSAEYPPQTVSTGVPFCIVLLRSLEVAQRLQLVQQEAQAWTAKNDAQFFYCIAPLPEDGRSGLACADAVLFGRGSGDGFGGGMLHCVAGEDGTGRVGEAVVIEQGIEMERPSRIGVEATREGERVHSVRVSGCTISVAEGRFFLP